MVRPVVLGIVLLCAVGPSASLFCKAWCDPHAAARNGCHDEDDGSAATVRSDTSCDAAILGSVSLLKEDLWRAPAPNDAVVLTARFLVSVPVAHGVPIWARGRTPSDLTRPQTMPLRI